MSKLILSVYVPEVVSTLLLAVDKCWNVNCEHIARPWVEKNPAIQTPHT